MSIKDPKQLCQSIIAMDHEIIAVTLLSLLGLEIESAYQPSAPLLISQVGEAGQKHVGKMVVSAVEALSRGEEFFGMLDQITVTFKRMKVLIVMNKPKQIVVVITALKEAEDKRIAFQVSKLISEWS